MYGLSINKRRGEGEERDMKFISDPPLFPIKYDLILVGLKKKKKFYEKFGDFALREPLIPD